MRIIEKMQVELKTTKWIVGSKKEGTLFVDNTFQRNYVWSRKDQVKLIETILLGYSIPEIYLYNVNVNPDSGDIITSIIDGQQRIGAVCDYINDEFALSARYLGDNELSFADKKFSELSPDEKTIIWGYPFTSRVINTSVERKYIVELFLRLNATDKTLNPQELRNAEFNGQFISLADKISELEFWEKIFTSSKVRRMQDIDFISQILVYFRLGIDSDLSQESINKVYDMFNENYDNKESDYLRFVNILDVLSNFTENNNILNFMKKVTHLYTLIVVIDYLIQNNREMLDSAGFIQRVDKFAYYILNNQDNLMNLSTNEKEALSEYSQLSLEGTKRKSNRLARVNILKNFIIGKN